MLESPDYAWCSAESEIVWTRSNDCSLTNPSYLWAWDGVGFRKAPSLEENRWSIDESAWPRGPLLRRFYKRRR